jgi:hypothetical protein
MRARLIKRGNIVGRNQETSFEELTSASIESGALVEVISLDILEIEARGVSRRINEIEKKREF